MKKNFAFTALFLIALSGCLGGAGGLLRDSPSDRIYLKISNYLAEPHRHIYEEPLYGKIRKIEKINQNGPGAIYKFLDNGKLYSYAYSPITETTYYQYDREDRLTISRKTTPSPNGGERITDQTSYVYDDRGLLVEKSTPDRPEFTVTYTYTPTPTSINVTISMPDQRDTVWTFDKTSGEPISVTGERMYFTLTADPPSVKTEMRDYHAQFSCETDSELKSETCFKMNPGREEHEIERVVRKGGDGFITHEGGSSGKPFTLDMTNYTNYQFDSNGNWIRREGELQEVTVDYSTKKVTGRKKVRDIWEERSIEYYR